MIGYFDKFVQRDGNACIGN